MNTRKRVPIVQRWLDNASARSKKVFVAGCVVVLLASLVVVVVAQSIGNLALNKAMVVPVVLALLGCGTVVGDGIDRQREGTNT